MTADIIVSTDPNQDAIEDAQDFGEPLARVDANGSPPSTVGELRQVLIDFEASRPRSMQVALGPSEWGAPCQQQIARKLAGAPQRPVLEPAWAPFLGTAGHTRMEHEVLPFWNDRLGEERWLAEDELLIAPDQDDLPGVSGHGDAYDRRYAMVVDWKFVSEYALNKIRAARRKGLPPAEQVSPEYRVQGHSYGKGHAAKGRPVRWIRVVFFARTSSKFDDSEEWTEAYDETIADRAAERYFDTARLVRELDLEHHPDQIAGVPANPGDTCRFCPFHRPDRGVTTWESCSGLAGDNPGREAMARLRRSTLINGIKVAKSVRELEEIWEDAQPKGLWTDEATAAAKRRKAAIIGGPDNCSQCNYATHTCPGCGADVPHGQIACTPCAAL